MIDKSIYIFTRLSGNKLYQFKRKKLQKSLVSSRNCCTFAVSNKTKRD